MAGYYPRPGAQLPLTPPGSGSGYGYRSVPYPQDSYVSHQTMGQPRHENSYDYQQGYMPQAVAPAPPAYQYPQSGYQPTTSLPPMEPHYKQALGAPTLPPLLMNERAQYSDGYPRHVQQEHRSVMAHEQQRHAPREEKATGGVSAKLDYDMECMTDFVTAAAQSVFGQVVPAEQSFRKWIHQVLSATRLPSATILLSLHYLNDRAERFPDSIMPGSNSVYRMLAVSLILGSKFLDDNTFINRSWSDVTSIKVQELNLLEMKWLHLINYQLHIDPSANNGLQGWIDAWKVYERKYAAKQPPVRLLPLDTNVHRHATVQEQQYSPYPTPYSASSRLCDASLQHRPAHVQYPSNMFGAVDSWSANDRAHADDFYKPQHHYAPVAGTDQANRRASDERARQSAYGYPPSAHPSYYHAPIYGSAWDQHGWNGGHRHDCNCHACGYQQHLRPYPMTSSYSAQTVMG